MKKFIKILTSTDHNSVLIKLSVFFVLMILSFVNLDFSIVAFYLSCAFAFIEFSYNSVIYLILYCLCSPYSSVDYYFYMLIIFAGVFLTRFIVAAGMERKDNKKEVDLDKQKSLDVLQLVYGEKNE